MSDIDKFKWEEMTNLLKATSRTRKQEWTAKKNIVMPGRGIGCSHYEVC